MQISFANYKQQVDQKIKEKNVAMLSSSFFFEIEYNFRIKKDHKLCTEKAR